jgi:protein-tyrosine phosphatase
MRLANLFRLAAVAAADSLRLGGDGLLHPDSADREARRLGPRAWGRVAGRWNVHANTTATRVGAAVLVIVCGLVCPAAADSQGIGQGSSAPVTGLPRIRIDNFGCAGPKYCRGSQPSGRDYGDLAALGIKAVINLASDDADPHERGMVEASGMKYFQLPMTTHEPPTPARLVEFLSMVTDQANQPVFVHCIGGRHRTGVMTAVYRMTEDHWTAAQAFEEMKRYKFGSEFLHREFKEFVYRYGAELTRGAPAQTVSAPPKTGGH